MTDDEEVLCMLGVIAVSNKIVSTSSCYGFAASVLIWVVEVDIDPPED